MMIRAWPLIAGLLRQACEDRDNRRVRYYMRVQYGYAKACNWWINKRIIGSLFRGEWVKEGGKIARGPN